MKKLILLVLNDFLFSFVEEKLDPPIKVSRSRSYCYCPGSFSDWK